MKAPPFHYHAPRSLQEALDLLRRLDNARVLGGGQSLMPMLNLRVAMPDHLVDLGRIPELAGIIEGEGIISIGAMSTQRSIERSRLIRQRCPLLGQAIDHVGHQQTRNRGTIGGSLCHLDPSAELPVVALALDAELTIAGSTGTRMLPFREFPAGYLTVALESDEILTRIDVPKIVPGSGSAFLEFSRRPADFAIVSVAVQLSVDPGGRLTRAAIAVGGIDYSPMRLVEAENAITGHYPTRDLFQTASELTASLDCEGDELYPAEYRRDLCGVLVERALAQAAERAGAQANV
jgi:aerobic carbon-monoxide dehydrogenase medium subunit